MASRRLRQRAQARPWQQTQPEPAIDWQSLSAELRRREQQQGQVK